MNLDEGIRYCDKRKDYDDCLMNLGREEGIELGRSEGEKIGYANGEKDGLYKGIELGFERGRNEGIEYGRNTTLLETAYKMYENGMDSNNIKKITGVDMNEVLSKNKQSRCNNRCNRCKNHNNLKKKIKQ